MKISISATLTCLILSAPMAHGLNLEKTIAYIECTTRDEQGASKTLTGSGVVVSAKGHVLTARHIAPVGSSCRASLGVADTNNSQRLVHRPLTNGGYDMALLQLSTADTPDFLKYCALSDAMIRKPIFTAGFPLGTSTGKPSFRAGIMSTTFLTEEGYVETDSLTAEGMSGGPVLADDEKSLIGIVSGAKFLPDGTPQFYGISPIVGIQATQLDLKRNEEGCYLPKPTTEELLAKIVELESQLLEKTQELNGKISQEKQVLAERIELSAEELIGQIKGSKEELSGKIAANKDELVGITTKHDAMLKAHADSLVDMKDHPDRLKEAEGTLSEVEANIEWRATIDDKTGHIKVSYKKIVSSGGGIDQIGLFVAASYSERRSDGEEGFVNKEGVTLVTYPPSRRPLVAQESRSKLGGYFLEPKAIINGFIIGKYDLTPEDFHPEHPLTALEVTITPLKDGARGENVTLTIRITRDQWRRIYDNYLENAQNGV